MNPIPRPTSELNYCKSSNIFSALITVIYFVLLIFFAAHSLALHKEIKTKDIAISAMFNRIQKLMAADRNCIIKDKHGHEHIFKNCKVEAAL